MLLLFAQFIAAFSSYGRAVQIGFAMSIGLVLALIPGGTVLWFLIFIPMMLIRINQAAMLGTMGVFRLLAPLYDPMTENLGYFLLTRDSVAGVMKRILSVPGFSWLQLDNTLVFGGLVSSLLGFVVFLLFFTVLVLIYRRYMAQKVRQFFGRLSNKIPWLKKLSKFVTAARRMGTAV